MSHYLNRSTVKTPVADNSASRTPKETLQGIERHQGTTRVPRPRVLKPPIG